MRLRISAITFEVPYAGSTTTLRMFELLPFTASIRIACHVAERDESGLALLRLRVCSKNLLEDCTKALVQPNAAMLKIESKRYYRALYYAKCVQSAFMAAYIPRIIPVPDAGMDARITTDILLDKSVVAAELDYAAIRHAFEMNLIATIENRLLDTIDREESLRLSEASHNALTDCVAASKKFCHATLCKVAYRHTGAVLY